MNRKKITAITACLIMALSLTACGSQTSQPGQSSQSAQNTQTADSGSVTEQDLLDEENKILSENQELWEKVFGAMDKNVTNSDLSKNYGEFLLDTIEKAKDQFTDEEYETLRAGAEKIRDIENQIAQLPQDDSSSDTASANSFPQFDGYDLDGNKVDSSLFSNNEFTVVNFWFSGCK
ncbi:MAG TPA: TlpA family protein disulfide reductase, partial [Ruminococcaceae bacterium]|nr:TlpA family protein disulfide reductase [Oscillospiraceae bacterium]